MSSNNKKVVLVTGAGRGIGRKIFEYFASAGFTVIGGDYNINLVSELNDYLKDKAYFGEGVALDVTSQETIEKVLVQTSDRYGAPNILINNAGITLDNLMLRMSDQEWTKVIETNLTSVFRMSRACLRGMVKARWGRIINIASVVAYMGNAGQANYAATKAGVVGFSKSLAIEVASRNITVNCVAPGFIKTEMTDQLSKEQQEKLLEVIPMKRMGTVEDVVGVVKFLSSDDAAYLTGSTIHVNGGMYMI